MNQDRRLLLAARRERAGAAHCTAAAAARRVPRRRWRRPGSGALERGVVAGRAVRRRPWAAGGTGSAAAWLAPAPRSRVLRALAGASALYCALQALTTRRSLPLVRPATARPAERDARAATRRAAPARRRSRAGSVRTRRAHRPRPARSAIRDRRALADDLELRDMGLLLDRRLQRERQDRHRAPVRIVQHQRVAAAALHLDRGERAAAGTAPRQHAHAVVEAVAQQRLRAIGQVGQQRGVRDLARRHRPQLLVDRLEDHPVVVDVQAAVRALAGDREALRGAVAVAHAGSRTRR